MNGRRLLMSCAILWALIDSSAASPWRPTDAQQVIERLPAHMPQPHTIPTRPVSLDATAPQIQALLEQAYVQGDPRALGQADALLAPFAQDNSTQAQLLRANMAQADHQFDFSRRALLRLLSQTPDQPDALLMLSSIDLVQGRFQDAQRRCGQIKDLSLLPLRVACVTQVDLMTRPLRDVAPRLAALARLTPTLTPSQARWIGLMQADAAQRSNNAALAQQAFAQLDDSMPALVAQADWLLAHRQWQAVRDLLITHTDNDSLLLRLTISEIHLKHPEANAHLQLLGERIHVWQQRGETAHQREEAAYAQLMGKPKRALELARLNWKNQRETADVVIYATAALVANSTADIRILQDWIKTTGFDYPILSAHLARGRLPVITQAERAS